MFTFVYSIGITNNNMKDTNGNEITQEEFTKDIGHRTEAPAMTDLKTLQEEGDKALDLRFTNLGREDEGLTILTLNEVQTKLKPFIQSERQKAYTLGMMKGVEMVEGVVKRNIEIENWSHSVGSHSDDRGGDSDIECTCREKEVRYKQEALNSILSNITKLKQELK